MKLIEYVKVDARDGRPETEFPLRHGPADPLDGITWVRTSSRSVPPKYYGFVHGNTDTSVPGVLRELYPAELAAFLSDWIEEDRARLAEVRYYVETGGIEVGQNYIDTSRDGRDRIEEVLRNLERGTIRTAEFKNYDEWITVTLDEMHSISSAVAQHVQGCFAAERKTWDIISKAKGPVELKEPGYISLFFEKLEEIKAAQ